MYCAARDNLRAMKKEYAKTEDDLKSLQSVGQIIGEVLRPLDNERCKSFLLVPFLFWLLNLFYCDLFPFLLVFKSLALS